MEFVPGSDFLGGIIHQFVKKGYPKIKLIPSSTSFQSCNVSNILNYEDDKVHWASDASEGLDANLIITLKNCYLRITQLDLISPIMII